MWLIDEYARIFRSLVWFSPIIPLTIILAIIIIIIVIIELLEYINKTMGASFCHVNKINVLSQFNPSIISGNQKWKGAAPILVNNDELKIILK